MSKEAKQWLKKEGHTWQVVPMTIENLENILDRYSSAYRGDEKDKKYFPVEFAGYWQIKTAPFYDSGEDILNAEDVGEEAAQKNAELISNLLNNHNAKRD